MSIAELRHVILALGLSVSAQVTVAANTVSLTPADQLVDLSAGMTSLELWMDFDDPTLGGGIDFFLSGPIGFGSFTPSEYFINDVDDSFSGHSGPEGSADNDYEVHFGDFNGLSGLNLLGTIDVLLLDEGIGTIDMSINSTWGEFFSATDFDPQDVSLAGANIQITAVPVPGAIWLMSSGLVLLGTYLRRTKQ